MSFRCARKIKLRLYSLRKRLMNEVTTSSQLVHHYYFQVPSYSEVYLKEGCCFVQSLSEPANCKENSR